MDGATVDLSHFFPHTKRRHISQVFLVTEIARRNLWVTNSKLPVGERNERKNETIQQLK